MSGFSLLIVLCTCFNDPPPGGVPDILVKAYWERTNYQTAFLKYKQITNRPGIGRQIEIFEARYSGDSVFLIDKGDDDGIRQKHPRTLEPSFGVAFACLPKNIVMDRENGDQWSHYDGSTFLTVTRKNSWRVISDVRSFGLYARDIQGKMPGDMLQVLYDSEKHTRWQVKREGELEVVQCRVLEPEGGEDDSYIACEWRIDPAKDFAIVQVTETYVPKEGEPTLVNRLKSEYVCKEGKWWPRKSESVAPHSGYSYSIEYEHVEFDRPDHPRKIGPDLFGLPVGIGVYAPEFNGRYLGDGEMVSEADWGGIKDRYDPAPLRAFWARNMASNRGTVPTWWGDERFALEGLAYTPDLWEVYVRRWILKYKYSQFYDIDHPHPLSEQQINAALAILKDCRKKARPILESVSKELSAINKALGSSSSPAPGESVEELEPKDTEANRRKANLLARRKAKLEEPNPGIVRLFAELKQRLDDLLRLEQRAYAVNSRPSPVTARVGRKAE